MFACFADTRGDVRVAAESKIDEKKPRVTYCSCQYSRLDGKARNFFAEEIVPTIPDFSFVNIKKTTINMMIHDIHLTSQLPCHLD